MVLTITLMLARVLHVDAVATITPACAANDDNNEYTFVWLQFTVLENSLENSL